MIFWQLDHNIYNGKVQHNTQVWQSSGSRQLVLISLANSFFFFQLFEQFSDTKIIDTFGNISDWLWSCDLPQQTMLTKCRDRDKLWKVGYLSKALGDKFEDKKLGYLSNNSEFKRQKGGVFEEKIRAEKAEKW